MSVFSAHLPLSLTRASTLSEQIPCVHFLFHIVQLTSVPVGEDHFWSLPPLLRSFHSFFINPICPSHPIAYCVHRFPANFLNLLCAHQSICGFWHAGIVLNLVYNFLPCQLCHKLRISAERFAFVIIRNVVRFTALTIWRSALTIFNHTRTIVQTPSRLELPLPRQVH